MIKVLMLGGNTGARARLAKYLQAAGYDVASSFSYGSDETEKNLHAAALGRLGGLVGGRVRAARLSAEERSTIARKAARARWARAGADRMNKRGRAR
jgi:hypothetical protein